MVFTFGGGLDMLLVHLWGSPVMEVKGPPVFLWRQGWRWDLKRNRPRGQEEVKGGSRYEVKGPPVLEVKGPPVFCPHRQSCCEGSMAHAKRWRK